MNTFIIKLPRILFLGSILVLTACAGSESSSWEKGRWITEAFSAIAGGLYPEIKAVSWWHENWENGDGTFSKLRTSHPADRRRLG